MIPPQISLVTFGSGKHHQTVLALDPDKNHKIFKQAESQPATLHFPGSCATNEVEIPDKAEFSGLALKEQNSRHLGLLQPDLVWQMFSGKDSASQNPAWYQLLLRCLQTQASTD